MSKDSSAKFIHSINIITLYSISLHLQYTPLSLATFGLWYFLVPKDQQQHSLILI